MTSKSDGPMESLPFVLVSDEVFLRMALTMVNIPAESPQGGINKLFFGNLKNRAKISSECVHKYQPPLWTFGKLPKMTFVDKISLTKPSHVMCFIITDISEVFPSQKFMLLQKYHKK